MGTSTSALSDLRRTIELALRGGVMVSAGAARLPEHRVPPMPPLRLVSFDHRQAPVHAGAVFTGVSHREDLAA